MKFGISFGFYPFGLPPVDFIVGLAERVEEAGFDSFMGGDHISFYGPVLDLFQVLAACAPRTRRLVLGTAVYLLPLRHPTVAAKAAATLDVLAGGRTVFGIGIGGENPKEFEACGIDPKERGRRADEGIRVVRALWTGKPASFAGRYYRFSDVLLEPRPVQPSGPPIWVGGRSEAALRRAATLGDGWISYVVTPERYRESAEKIEAFAEAAGRSLDGFAWAHQAFLCLGPDYESAARTAGDFLTRSYNQPFDQPVRKYGILGTTEDVIAQVEKFVDAGVEHLIFEPCCAWEEIPTQVERFGREILPHFRE